MVAPQGIAEDNDQNPRIVIQHILLAILRARRGPAPEFFTLGVAGFRTVGSTIDLAAALSGICASSRNS